MFKLKGRKTRIKAGGYIRQIDPLAQQVRKILGNVDQRLIVMVRG